jgi:hypothetical protein
MQAINRNLTEIRLQLSIVAQGMSVDCRWTTTLLSFRVEEHRLWRRSGLLFMGLVQVVTTALGVLGWANEPSASK